MPVPRGERSVLRFAALVWLIAGCGSDDGDTGAEPDATAGAGGVGARPAAGTAGSAGAPGAGAPASPPAAPLPAASIEDASGITADPACALAVDGACTRAMERTVDDVCGRWIADYPDTTADWHVAPADACDPGMATAASIDDALRRLNLYRWLVGSDPVVQDDAWAENARWCAIIQAYLGEEITHYPEPDVQCYTEEGATSSADSQISSGSYSAAHMVTRLIWDNGDNNARVLGHRQGMLHPSATRVGIAHTSNAIGGGCVQQAVPGETWPAKPSGLDGMVAYPAPGVFPLETIHWSLMEGFHEDGRAADRLQWSVAVDGLVPADARVRLYQQTADDWRAIPLAFGPLEKTTEGLWIHPQEDLDAGTYVVIVEGTPLGAFGYRIVFEACGPLGPHDCDPVAQDCGDPTLGCYGTSEPFCARAGAAPEAAACTGLFDCAAGAECVGIGGGGSDICAPYCASDPTAPDACDTLCPGNWAEAWGVNDAGEVVMLEVGLCSGAALGSCDPLAQDCGPGLGCYGQEETSCLPAGDVPRGAECTIFGETCVPGTKCISFSTIAPGNHCRAYCDPNTDTGVQSCESVCTSGAYSFGDYAICFPDPA